jgi:hypothetical protein
MNKISVSDLVQVTRYESTLPLKMSELNIVVDIFLGEFFCAPKQLITG